MRKFDFFWATNRDWYHWTEDGDRVINPDAPPEAQESYKHYLEQDKKAREEMEKYGYAD